jgi:transcriptional regulator with XRE-family HTH domain
MKCRIREIREKKGISIGQLARITGLTGGAISLIERGFRNPNMSTIFKIRDALGVPLDELYMEDEDANV